MVLGQNGSGQNGMDKMVRTKWYEYNGADKIINQSIKHVPTDNMIFSSIPLPLGSLYISSVCLALFLTSGYQISINFTLIVIYSKTCYHFVCTILSIPFCPMTFCPYTILSAT